MNDMNIIINHYKMLMYLCKASSIYLPVNIIKKIFETIKIVGGILFIKFITNSLESVNFNYKKLIYNFAIYYLLLFIEWCFSYYIDNIFNIYQHNKIKIYMQSLIYQKVKTIDMESYDNNEFYQDYLKSGQSHDKVIHTGNMILQLFSYLLNIFTWIALLTTTNFIFLVAAIIMCIISTITAILSNHINNELYNKQASILLKSNGASYYLSYGKTAKEVKLYKMYDFFILKYNTAIEEYKRLKVKSLSKIVKIICSTNIMLSFIRMLVNIYVIYQIIDKKLTIGDFVLVMASINILSNHLGNFIKFIPSLKNDNIYIEYMNKILNYVPDIPDHTNGIVAQKENGFSFKLENVSFSYPMSKDVLALENINLEIEAGTKIAIVGQNGSGKSTLAKLLMYIYKNDNGKIFCNNKLYEDYNTNSLRSIFGILFQEFQIFNFSIAENILMREADSDEDRILVWEALKFSGLYSKVKNLDNGIYSVITKEFDNDGIYFSGGEQQKLAIARTYAKKANVLIFDEPSSSLDPVSENEFYEKIMSLGKEKTIIYISHRLSTVINADLIIMLEQGKIIEKGTHTELMRLNGKYKKMFLIQAENYIINYK